MTRKELAEALGISPRQVDNLVVDGLPRRKRGREWEYDQAAIVWYFERKLERLEVQRSPTLDEARAREALARAEKTEYELAQTRGQMLGRDVWERELNLLLDLLRAKIQTVPGKYPPRFLNLRSYGEARVALEDLTRELLTDLSMRAAEELEQIPLEEPPSAGDASQRHPAVARRRRRRTAKAS